MEAGWYFDRSKCEAWRSERRSSCGYWQMSQISWEVDLFISYSTWYNFCCEYGKSIYAFSLWGTSWSCILNSSLSESNSRERFVFWKNKNEKRGIEVYTDADWASSITDRRSTFEYYTFLWGNLVTWRSKTQSVVARGSVEAEFHSMA